MSRAGVVLLIPRRSHPKMNKLENSSLKWTSMWRMGVTLEVNNGHFIKAALKELMSKLPLGGLLLK